MSETQLGRFTATLPNTESLREGNLILITQLNVLFIVLKSILHIKFHYKTSTGTTNEVKTKRVIKPAEYDSGPYMTQPSESEGKKEAQSRPSSKLFNHCHNNRLE